MVAIGIDGGRNDVSELIFAIYFTSAYQYGPYSLLVAWFSMRLKILVGTMTGTADYVAQAIQMDCADLVSDIDVHLMDDLNIAVFAVEQAKDAIYIICTSTYGTGDVPENARALYESLDSAPEFLRHVRYGVMSLGNSIYPQTFCFGGQNFDQRLQSLGAQRIGEIWRHDASSSDLPEIEGVAWCRQWLASALNLG